MQVSEAIDLISHAALQNSTPQHWADLGCGSGLFSEALAHLLPDQSHILCCDKVSQGFANRTISNVELEFKLLDFQHKMLSTESLHGILMANSLHYVKDKAAFVDQWKKALKPGGKFIIVEYNTRESNPWVPYPIPFSELKSLFEKADAKNIIKLGERPSIYRSENMYACEVEFED